MWCWFVGDGGGGALAAMVVVDYGFDATIAFWVVSMVIEVWWNGVGVGRRAFVTIVLVIVIGKMGNL